MKLVERFEDMSPRGRLRLIIQDDGDIIVSIVPDPDEPIEYCKSVEFTTPGTGGGSSSRTHKALMQLFIAMKEDNLDKRLCGRQGEVGEGGSEIISN